VTHEYTILTGGFIAGGHATSRPTAVAWAAGTVLAVGDDAEVRAVSRGDSHFVELAGAVVQPLSGGCLEPGDAADFEIRDPTGTRTIAVVRGGHLVEGAFSGLATR
jgi:hypothetical protein